MKFCQYCGTQIDDSAKFCENCGKPTAVTTSKNTAEQTGAPVAAPVTFTDNTPVVIKPIVKPVEPVVDPSEKKGNGLAIASFVIGLTGVAGIFSYMSGSMALNLALIAGIVFGILGLRSKRKALAIIGLSFCSVLFLISAITFISDIVNYYWPSFGDQYDSVRYL